MSTTPQKKVPDVWYDEECNVASVKNTSSKAKTLPHSEWETVLAAFDSVPAEPEQATKVLRQMMLEGEKPIGVLMRELAHSDNPLYTLEKTAVFVDSLFSFNGSSGVERANLSPAEKRKFMRGIDAECLYAASVHLVAGAAFYKAGVSIPRAGGLDGLLSEETRYALGKANGQFRNAYDYFDSVESPSLLKQNRSSRSDLYSQYAGSLVMLADDSAALGQRILNLASANPRSAGENDLTLGFEELGHALQNYDLALSVLQTAHDAKVKLRGSFQQPEAAARLEKSVADLTSYSVVAAAQLGVPQFADSYVLSKLR